MDSLHSPPHSVSMVHSVRSSLLPLWCILNAIYEFPVTAESDQSPLLQPQHTSSSLFPLLSLSLFSCFHSLLLISSVSVSPYPDSQQQREVRCCSRRRRTWNIDEEAIAALFYVSKPVFSLSCSLFTLNNVRLSWWSSLVSVYFWISTEIENKKNSVQSQTLFLAVIKVNLMRTCIKTATSDILFLLLHLSPGTSSPPYVTWSDIMSCTITSYRLDKPRGAPGSRPGSRPDPPPLWSSRDSELHPDVSAAQETQLITSNKAFSN